MATEKEMEKEKKKLWVWYRWCQARVSETVHNLQQRCQLGSRGKNFTFLCSVAPSIR